MRLRRLALALVGALVLAFASGSSRTSGAPDEIAAVATPEAAGIVALDLEGRARRTSGRPDPRPLALVFVGLDAGSRPNLEAAGAFAKARAADLEVLGVVPDAKLTRTEAADLARASQTTLPLLFDATGELARALEPTRVGEAFLLSSAGRVVYRGPLEGEGALAAALADLAAGRTVAHPRRAVEGGAVIAAPASATPTYARDVAPILAARCVECHRSGAVAPFPLTTFAEAAKKAKTMATATETRYMPPWHVIPGFGEFEGERRLTDREVATLGAWAAAGAPEGDSRDLPPRVERGSGWQMGEPDLVLTMAHAFPVPASGPDVYRAFSLPAGLAEDRSIVGCEFQPGVPGVVHHCILFIDAKQEGRSRDGRSGTPGWPAFFTPGFTPLGQLGEWAPGNMASCLPEGMGRPFPRGSDVAVIVHYHPNGKAVQDTSRVGLYFAKKPITQTVESVPLWNQDIDIPAGERHYRRTAQLTLPVPITLVGVLPHMHLVGKEMKVVARHPEGALDPLVWVREWDFRWQDNYRFARPLRLEAETRLELEAFYDNSSENPQNPSDPPRRVVFGEKTNDEMCLCFLTVAVDDPADVWLIRGAVEGERRRHREEKKKKPKEFK